MDDREVSTGRDGVSRMSKAVCRTEGEWDREGGVGQGEGVGQIKGSIKSIFYLCLFTSR